MIERTETQTFQLRLSLQEETVWPHAIKAPAIRAGRKLTTTRNFLTLRTVIGYGRPSGLRQ